MVLLLDRKISTPLALSVVCVEKLSQAGLTNHLWPHIIIYLTRSGVFSWLSRTQKRVTSEPLHYWSFSMGGAWLKLGDTVLAKAQVSPFCRHSEDLLSFLKRGKCHYTSFILDKRNCFTMMNLTFFNCIFFRSQHAVFLNKTTAVASDKQSLKRCVILLRNL